MRAGDDQPAFRAGALTIMIGLALATSLLLGGAVVWSLLAQPPVDWPSTAAHPRSVVPVWAASPVATATPVTDRQACVAEGPRGPVGPPVVSWRYERGRTILTTPVLADGVLYVGSWDGHLAAVDARSGAERWRYQTGRMVMEPPIPGAPLVYVADAGGTIHAVEIATGRSRWRVATGHYPAMALAGGALAVVSGANAAAPAVMNDTVYVGGGSADLIVQLLDAATGSERWRVALMRNGLYALDTESGAERWQFGTESWVSAAPVVAGESIYVAGGSLSKVDAATGRERWRVPTGRGVVVTDVVAHDGMVYLVSNAAVRPGDSLSGTSRWLYAFDGDAGAERWRIATGGDTSSAPALAGSAVYVAGDGRNLYALDAMTGEVRWQLALGARLTTPLVDCGVLYAGTYGGALIAIANA